MLTLRRARCAADSTQCEISLSLVTRSFRGKGSAIIDEKQWAAFIKQVDRVASGESECAELHTGRAGLSLKIYPQDQVRSMRLVCNLRHPSFLDFETAIYATGAQFTVDKEALGAWLQESVPDANS